MKKYVVAAALAVAALVFITSAVASLPAGQALHYGGPGVHSWTKTGDSPQDANSRALRFKVGDGEWVSVKSNRSLNIATEAEQVGNLSFEFNENLHVGAGAPRISVQFQNGDVAYLSASYCNHPLAVSGGKWGRADFTRFHTNCTIFVNGETAGPAGSYSADGTRSAWQVYTDANPGQIVEQAYIVADEPGTYRLDRISLGGGAMYTAGDRVGKLCTTEASC
ncbi:MAG TPA: hypothetical protein VH281_00375 [Gaiellaceae bacterium]|jgi:hypothetical protein